MAPRALAALLLAPALAAAADITVEEIYGSGKVFDRASVIVATARTHAADTCRGFSLTESQIRDFFRKTQVMDPQALHSYRQAACEVEGHFLYQDQKFAFIVNAAYTGQIEVAPGRYVMFGCDAACKSIFDYGYPVPAAASGTAPR
ncbi:MAG TPA: hypothetical protein VF651_02215 [Gammaproteobacteria bacterium]